MKIVLAFAVALFAVSAHADQSYFIGCISDDYADAVFPKTLRVFADTDAMTDGEEMTHLPIPQVTTLGVQEFIFKNKSNNIYATWNIVSKGEERADVKGDPCADQTLKFDVIKYRIETVFTWSNQSKNISLECMEARDVSEQCAR